LVNKGKITIKKRPAFFQQAALKTILFNGTTNRRKPAGIIPQATTNNRYCCGQFAS